MVDGRDKSLNAAAHNFHALSADRRWDTFSVASDARAGDEVSVSVSVRKDKAAQVSLGNR